MRLYSTSIIDHGLVRYLFEDRDHTLYVWVDDAGFVKKVQFEVNDLFALELTESGLKSNRLYRGNERGVKGTDMFYRAFMESEDVSVFIRELDCLRSGKYKDFLMQIADAICEFKLSEIRFVLLKS